MYSDSGPHFSSDPPTGLGYATLGDGPPLHTGLGKKYADFRKRQCSLLETLVV